MSSDLQRDVPGRSRHKERVGTLIPTMNLPSLRSVRFSWNGDYNADQSRFLRVVQSVFLQRKALEVADLYEEPFTSFGLNAADKLFSESELEELVSLVRRLAA